MDIAKLMDQAEHADATDSDPQALPEALDVTLGNIRESG
ncbi:hypothetical protein AmDm5_0510 [Acetobacter malorum]|nr:hypothetical protein AmDm5_0510 [Acetobacter malorum]